VPARKVKTNAGKKTDFKAWLQKRERAFKDRQGIAGEALRCANLFSPCPREWENEFSLRQSTVFERKLPSRQAGHKTHMTQGVLISCWIYYYFMINIFAWWSNFFGLHVPICRHSGRSEAETRNPVSRWNPLDSCFRRNDEKNSIIKIQAVKNAPCVMCVQSSAHWEGRGEGTITTWYYKPPPWPSPDGRGNKGLFVQPLFILAC
jgi:hypothetical protein